MYKLPFFYIYLYYAKTQVIFEAKIQIKTVSIESDSIPVDDDSELSSELPSAS